MAGAPERSGRPVTAQKGEPTAAPAVPHTERAAPRHPSQGSHAEKMAAALPSTVPPAPACCPGIAGCCQIAALCSPRPTGVVQLPNEGVSNLSVQGALHPPNVISMVTINILTSVLSMTDSFYRLPHLQARLSLETAARPSIQQDRHEQPEPSKKHMYSCMAEAHLTGAPFHVQIPCPTAAAGHAAGAALSVAAA